MKIDLQIHSTASDGQYSPTELVKQYKKKGYVAMAICDHDTVKGLPEMIKAGKKYDQKVIPGIEMSSNHKGINIHILGYGIDHTNKALKNRCKQYSQAREARARKVVKKLKKLGFKIYYKDVDKISTGVVTRSHLALALMQEDENLPLLKKMTKGKLNVNNIIKSLMIKTKPAYIPYKKRTARQDITLIHKAGGLAILSHPGLLSEVRPSINIKTFIKSLQAIGLDGLEVYADVHNRAQTKYFKDIAQNLELVATAGSDFHGEAHPKKMASFTAPFWVWENLQKHLQK